MFHHKIQPVDSLDNLKDRVDRLLQTKLKRSTMSAQLSLDLKNYLEKNHKNSQLQQTPADFLEYLSSSTTNINLYLFGGILRDLALLGQRGFASDIDIVIDGDWHSCLHNLVAMGAQRNKFGGFRLYVSGWPIDIWSARETWAIRQGLVEYTSIESLTKTTILNWDAILMNWQTRKFICQETYLNTLKERQMDIVLRQNPNPLGAAVRVFRHLCSKDAKSITQGTAEYLADSAEKYSLPNLINYEIRSHGNTQIEPAIYKFFRKIKEFEHLEISERFEIASFFLRRDGETLSFHQLDLNL